MNTKKFILFLLAGIFLPMLLNPAVFAQFDMPEADNFSLSFMADGTSAEIRHQSYGASKRLGTAARHEIYLRARWGESRTSAREYMPKYLYGAGISVSAFSQKDSLIVSADSNSDKLYRSIKETDIGVNYFRTIEKWSSRQSTWMFVLNYSSRRSFWEGVPIPFLAFRYMSEKYVFIAPFFGQYNLNRQWGIYAQWVPLYLYKTGIKWKPSEKFELDFQNGISADQFLISGRDNDKEALYIKKSYLKIMPKWKINRYAEISGYAGWVFRSSFYHGEGYSDVNDKVKTGEGAEAMAALKFFF